MLMGMAMDMVVTVTVAMGQVPNPTKIASRESF
jgi:hypothetical protein